jgi:hypothetical protein
MMTHSDKLKKVVDTLIEKTESGELNWGLAHFGKGAITDLKSTSVLVVPSLDEAGQDAVKVTLKQGDQDELMFDDTSIVVFASNGRRYSYYQKMKNLLDNAVRSARGEDKIVDSVLAELGVNPADDDDVPF